MKIPRNWNYSTQAKIFKMLNDINRIKILPPEEARRIAAGEVVDRPAALLREFLDNAIDAGSLNIEVSIEEGGCKKVEVSDDGSGMSPEDLKLCFLAHATSKIRAIDDLDTAVTLGFRGEALAAAAAVSRLEIITSMNGREAFSLVTGPGGGNACKTEQTRRTKGTTIRALNLFETIPARKRFLKREGSEAALCRQIFTDKALAFNGINFRFQNGGKLLGFLPAVSTKKERFAAAVMQDDKNFLHEINVSGSGFTAEIVIGSPQLFKNDRRSIYIFANGRRIQDYSLMQAVEYGSQGWFPNGTHPVGAVYINIDPSLADFNIHPAKREVRFRDPGAVHQAISGGVKNFFHGLYLKDSHGNAKNTEAQKEDSDRNTELFQRYSYEDTKAQKHEEVREREYQYSFNNKSVTPANISVNAFDKEEMRYAGRIFGLFILIEWGDKLYIIDQHAAHERILYNRFLEEQVPKQELLTPIPFVTESDDEDAFLKVKRGELSRLGIDIKKDDEHCGGDIADNGWQITSLPADWKIGDAATVKEILELRTAGENMAQRWAASLCCKAAVKDGDYLDGETSLSLAKEALALAEPFCPHGRPVWTEINRQALLKAVKRE